MVTAPSINAEIPSPKKQRDAGMASEDILCRNELILAIRDNDDPVCVTEKTADRMGWDIVKQNQARSYNDNKVGFVNLGINLENIPNPTGYWIPIEDPDNFAKLLAFAVDDRIIENKTKAMHNSMQYTTELGGIEILDHYTTSSIRPEVAVYSHQLIEDEKTQYGFINNFMEKMGFKVGDGHKLTDDLFNKCGQNSVYHKHCKFDDNHRISMQFVGDRTIYTLEQPYSFIEFVFFDNSFVTYGHPGIKISFGGWTHNPELVIFQLEPDVAIQKAYDFIKTNEELNMSAEKGGKCEVTFLVCHTGPSYRAGIVENSGKCETGLRDDFINSVRAIKVIISGVPFYSINLTPGAACLYEYGPGHWNIPMVLIDGVTGENAFVTYRGDVD